MTTLIRTKPVTSAVKFGAHLDFMVAGMDSQLQAMYDGRGVANPEHYGPNPPTVQVRIAELTIIRDAYKESARLWENATEYYGMTGDNLIKAYVLLLRGVTKLYNNSAGDAQDIYRNVISHIHTATQ